MPLPKLSGDPQRDLSPLTGNLDQDLGPTNTQVSPGAQSPALVAPRTSQGPLSQGLSNVLKPIGQAVNQNPIAGPISRAIGEGPPASLAAPGAGLLGNMVGQGVAGAGEALTQGRGPLAALKEGASGAVGSGALGVLGKGVSKATSALRLPGYAEKISEKLVEKLKSSVPAWEKMKSVKDMLYTQRGQGSLHRAYDESFKNVVKKASGTLIEMTAEDAKALGIKSMVGLKNKQLAASGRGIEAPPLVEVDAGDVVKGVQGKWKKDPHLYRRTTNLLDQHGFTDPEAKKAYTTAMGLRAYLDKTGSIRPDGTLDVIKAQAGLTKGKKIDELLKRDLGEYTDILAPGGKTLTKGDLGGAGAAIGAGLTGAGGVLGGGHFGMGPLGGVLGAGHGAWLGNKIGSKFTTYDLPEGPTQNAITQLLQRLGGMGGAKAAE